MDTENFIVSRAQLVEQLQRRRSSDVDSYPFKLMRDYGIQLPVWARLGLSFMTRGGVVTRLMEIALPLTIPLLFKKQMPFFDRLVHRIFSRKS